jgi:hypothetical protein
MHPLSQIRKDTTYFPVFALFCKKFLFLGKAPYTAAFEEISLTDCQSALMRLPFPSFGYLARAWPSPGIFPPRPSRK